MDTVPSSATRRPTAIGALLPSAPHPLAPAIVGYSLLAGIAADALIAHPVGVGFTLWVALLALIATALVWRDGRELSGEASAWLLTAVLFAMGPTWRASETMTTLDIFATLIAFAMAAIAIGDPDAGLFAARLRQTFWSGFRVGLSTLFGAIPLMLRDFSLPGTHTRSMSRFRAVVRPAIIAIVIAVVFGALLRGADPVFASLVASPDIDADTLLTNGFTIGCFAWIAGGWARAALIDAEATPASTSAAFTLGVRDINAALGTLIVLFTAFVLVQLGTLFGGERFLQAQTGLTAATYAREGFLQLVWVAVLVIPVIVVTRASLRPGRALARRHTALALPVIMLVGAIIVSAVSRMRMYVRFYGLTEDRFDTLVFMAWLGVVLLWLGYTLYRRRERLFVAGAMISGFGTLAAMNVISPDAVVTRVNITRASDIQSTTNPSLDLIYLTKLSGDAVPLTVAAVLTPIEGANGTSLHAASVSQHCHAATALLEKWGDSSDLAEAGRSIGGWRSMNAGNAEAMRVVGLHAIRLRRMAHRCQVGADWLQ